MGDQKLGLLLFPFPEKHKGTEAPPPFHPREKGLHLSLSGSTGFCHRYQSYGMSWNLEEEIMVHWNEPQILSPESWHLVQTTSAQ